MSSRSTLALIAMTCIVAVLLYLYAHRSQAPNLTISSGQCDSALWEHVYHAQRLHVLNPCTTVTGVIEKELKERDGDYHLRLRLDRQFDSMLNDKNRSSQYGDLVVEVICQNRVVQDDAMTACESLDRRWEIPSVGTHVQVTGPYVYDTDHGWNEIHPVNSIVEQ